MEKREVIRNNAAISDIAVQAILMRPYVFKPMANDRAYSMRDMIIDQCGELAISEWLAQMANDYFTNGTTGSESGDCLIRALARYAYDTTRVPN